MTNATSTLMTKQSYRRFILETSSTKLIKISMESSTLIMNKDADKDGLNHLRRTMFEIRLLDFFFFFVSLVDSIT